MKLWVCTLTSTHPRLPGACELGKLSCKLSLFNSHELSSSFDQDMKVKKTLIKTIASQLLSTLILIYPGHYTYFQLKL